MTCVEKYMLDHPDTENIYDVVRDMCPSDFYYHHDPSYCANADDTRCMRCWTRELNMYGKGTCDCYDPEYERCNGTKERDKCSCNGNESQCDFYPEKRGETEKKTIVAHMPPFDTVEDSVSEATKSEEIEARCCGGRLIIGDEEVEHPDTDFPKILDSGNRREFETGAVRDIQEGKGRCDLMPLDVVSEHFGDAVIGHIHDFMVDNEYHNLYYALGVFSKHWDDGKCKETRDDITNQRLCTMFLEVSKHFEEGAKKYGEHNWQKGIPTNCYIDSAVRHYLKFLRGDTDEPHDRAFIWNILCCIWTCKHKPELNVYRKEE